MWEFFYFKIRKYEFKLIKIYRNILFFLVCDKQIFVKRFVYKKNIKIYNNNSFLKKENKR